MGSGITMVFACSSLLIFLFLMVSQDMVSLCVALAVLEHCVSVCGPFGGVFCLFGFVLFLVHSFIHSLCVCV